MFKLPQACGPQRTACLSERIEGQALLLSNLKSYGSGACRLARALEMAAAHRPGLWRAC